MNWPSGDTAFLHVVFKDELILQCYINLAHEQHVEQRSGILRSHYDVIPICHKMSPFAGRRILRCSVRRAHQRDRWGQRWNSTAYTKQGSSEMIGADGVEYLARAPFAEPTKKPS